MGAGDADVEFLHLNLLAAWVDAVQALVALITSNQAAFVIGANGHPRALVAFGYGVEKIGLEALGYLDRAAIFKGIAAARRAGKYVAPRAVAHLAGGDSLAPVRSLAGFPLAEKGAGCLPGGVGDQRSFLTRNGHFQLSHKTSDTTFIAAFDCDDVFSWSQQLGNVFGVLIIPLVAGEGRFPIDVRGEAIVAGGDQLGLLDFAGGQVKGFAKVDGLVFLRPIRPDPLWSLCGS